jgi:hypothetical protein
MTFEPLQSYLTEILAFCQARLFYQKSAGDFFSEFMQLKVEFQFKKIIGPFILTSLAFTLTEEAP